ncbi:hypothetical protein CFC21_024223 [Triticum aestivum]|uniref:Uncharacterized protein n=3 Tax=Triticum TaxID=4564 RepID=A0A9R1PTL1_TRITD|nr:hypothetical protein CFC21_024223 [Triticum aestivum]VAH48875.1 unnamed protein product [Triticum turgidum subsp. durum]
MMKLRCPNPKKLFRRSSSKISRSSSSCSSSSSDNGSDAGGIRGGGGSGEIEWEVRPGGMLVQRRDGRGDVEIITVRVATGYSWHEVSIGATCTFGEKKVSTSLFTQPEALNFTSISPSRVVDPCELLNLLMVMWRYARPLARSPALKDIKLRAALAAQGVQSPYQTFIKV